MKKICLVVMTVLSVVLVSCLTFSMKSIWVSNDTIDLDAQQSEQRSIRLNNGEIETWNCFKVSEADIVKCWSKVPDFIVYRGTTWITFEPEYDFLEEYNDSFQRVMYKYDIICSPVKRMDDGTCFTTTYIINRKTGQIIVL